MINQDSYFSDEKIEHLRTNMWLEHAILVSKTEVEMQRNKILNSTDFLTVSPFSQSFIILKLSQLLMTIKTIYDALELEKDSVGVVSYLYIVLNIISLWYIIATIKKLEKTNIDQ